MPDIGEIIARMIVSSCCRIVDKIVDFVFLVKDVVSIPYSS